MANLDQSLIILIINLRQFHKPAEIAIMVGKTEGAINLILHREKKKGAIFPKLRHGKLIYDKAKAQEWREMIRKGMKYSDIKREQGTSPTIICRTLALEARNELRW